MRAIVFILIGFFSYFGVLAQHDTSIYELLNELKQAKEDTLKADIFLQLAGAYRSKDSKKAINNAKMALILAENNEDVRRQFNILDMLLRIHMEDKYDLQGFLKYLEKAKSIHTKTKLDQQATLIGHIGKFHLALNDFEKAQVYFLQQLRMYALLADEVGKAVTYYELGDLFYYQEYYQKALNYYNKALVGFTESNELQKKVECLNALGRTYGQLKAFKKERTFCTEAFYLSETLGIPGLTAKVQINLGKAYQKLGATERAVYHFKQALGEGQKLDNEWIVISAKLAMAKTFVMLDSLHTAENLLAEALLATKSIDDILLKKEVYQNLFDFYQINKDTTNAFIYLHKLADIKDEFFDEQRSKQLIVNQIRFESNIKEKENKYLKAVEVANKITIQKQRLQNYVLLTGIFLLMALAFIFYTALKRKKEYNKLLEYEVQKRTKELIKSNSELVNTNVQLEQSNLELERFAYIASHDLKSPLRNIISFLNLIQRKLDKTIDRDVPEYLDFAINNAKQMHALIQDVLEYSKIDTYSSNATNEPVNLNHVLLLVTQNLNTIINQKDATIEYDDLPLIKTNPVFMLQLFQNLISNGIKYNESKPPIITITYEERRLEHFFTISDNGIGIAPEYHQDIFEMFKRLHSVQDYKGTGIGLAICKKIIKQLGGTIRLESEETKGTIFYFTIPISPTEPQKMSLKPLPAVK